VSIRTAIGALSLLALCAGTGWVQAADCPGNPNALGTSRTIVLNPVEHPLLGTLQYNESLPLNDHEVVLTFDDGPLPPYTTRVLDTLAAECIKATFFLVGRMALGYPRLVQREYNEGHTIAGHSQNHPFTFAKMSVDAAAKEIEDGFESVRQVLGDPRAVAPFFRIPGLLRQDAVEQYLESRHYATFSLDFLADDWTHISSKEIIKRALQRIEARKRGILLLHDIQPATALALPTILAELKARGYKIVQVVPSTSDRPATVALSDDWVQRHPTRPSWPRVLSPAEPTFEVPSPANFGVDPAGQVMALGTRGDVAWPNDVRFTALPGAELLLVPDEAEFIYHPKREAKIAFAAAAPVERVPPRPKPDAASKVAAKPGSPGKTPAPNAPGSPGSAAPHTKPAGHQLSISKPTASVLDLLRLGRN
jgi:peptidoglycan/xylan/chitin deacetylase (PgdA/CDA1 family)